MRITFPTILLLSAAICSATPTVTLALQGVGGATQWNGVYSFPYTMLIGTGSAAQAAAMMCDDYTDEIAVSESWQAIDLALTAANVTQFQFYSNFSSDADPVSAAMMAYNEAAYLYTDAIQHPANDPIDNAAVWKIFDPSLSVGSDVLTQLTAAAGAVTPTTYYSDIRIFTPANPALQTSGGRPQEFITTTPEPPASLLLAAGGLLIAALGALRRKRASRA